MPEGAEVLDSDAVPAADGAEAAPQRRPNLQGDLDTVLEYVPVFRPALRGYDRWQVDSYVSWAERELRAARRSADEMASRFAAAASELEQARSQLARSEDGRTVRAVSDRIGQMLELAADEATALTAAGAAEADRLVDRARAYAAAMLRHAREVEEVAAGQASGVHELRAQAVAELEQARRDAVEVGRRADQERSRVDARAAEVRQQLDREAAEQRAQEDDRARRQREQEAAVAAAALEVAQQEIAELHRQRDLARESLRRLTDQIGDALDTLAGCLREDPPVDPPNVVATLPVRGQAVSGAVADR